MHDYLNPQQRGTKTREWAYRVLLASLLLVLAACQDAPRLTEVSLPTGTTTPIPAPTIAVTPTFIAVPTPTPETAAPCSMDVLAYVFAAELRLPAGSPELGRQVDSQEAYQSAFGVSPDLPYDPNQPETAINWYVQSELAALGIQLAENGRAVVLPEFAQNVGLGAIIQRDAPEAQIFFAGVNEGQAPDGALRAVIHASENGGYVVNLADRAGNYYLLVQEGTGQTIGWPGDVGVETVTDVVQLASPAGGEVVPLRVDGCDWILGVIGEDGRVAAALAMAPGMDAAALVWQMNPNPPEAVVTPAELAQEWQMHRFCLGEIEELNDIGNVCNLLTPEMTRPLVDSEVTRLWTRSEADGSLVPLPDGRVPVFDTERYGENGDFRFDRGLACTVRGWVPFPYNSGYPDAILVFCEARLDADDSQAVWIIISDDNPEDPYDNYKYSVEWLAEGVVPESGEATAERTGIDPLKLVDLFRSGQMDRRQIVIRYLEDETLANEQFQRIPNLALRQALETGEGIDWENAWPLFANRFYFDEELRELLEGD